MAAAVASILIVGVPVAGAAQPGASCANGSSAVDQYCENVPSANGHGTPPPGTPNTAPRLGTTLPQSSIRTIDRLPAKARKRARKLLSLTAPVPVRASITGSKGGWSLPLGVIIALIAVAAAGVTAALVRRRRGRPGDATGG
jgi:hypothetical protein